MKHAVLVLGLPGLVAAQQACNNQNLNPACPGLGDTCGSANPLCSAGSYCSVSSFGGGFYTGKCVAAGAPSIFNVYGAACNMSQPLDCQYFNPLALTPRTRPSLLQCIPTSPGDATGTCRIGPNKASDPCNFNSECASGSCQVGLRQCLGLSVGATCTPMSPDPCAPGSYCRPGNGGSGTCDNAVSPSGLCFYANSCQRNYFCSFGSKVPDGTVPGKCTAVGTVPNGQNTTVGPYMCQSYNAVLVQAGPTSQTSVYTCTDVNSTLAMIGQTCSPTSPVPPGYTCSCATTDFSTGNGQFQLVTVNGLGLGARAAAFQSLYKCLATSKDLMGNPCQYDAVDLEAVRYGSCAYYGCYPYYLQLVNSTGGRAYSPPLDRFVIPALLPCEYTAASAYYSQLMSTACLVLPNLSNWMCASLAGPVSLSVASTSGVIAFIFIVVFSFYWGHMFAYRKVNHTKFKIPSLNMG